MKFLVIILFGYLLDKLPLFVEVQEKFLRKFVMYFLRSTVIDIEGNPKLLETVFDLGMVLIDNGLGSSALLLGFNGNCRAMFIRTAYVHYIFFIKAKKSYVNISWYIGSCKMSNMQR